MTAVVVLMVLTAPPPPPPPPPPLTATTPSAPSPTAPAAPSDYGPVVQAALAATIPSWSRTNADRLSPLAKGAPAVGVELEIGADGAVHGEALAVSSGSNAVDDLARELLIETEPFLSPDPQLLAGGRSLNCLVRVAFIPSKKAPTIETAAACPPPEKAIAPVSGATPELIHAKDAIATLFVGFAAEGRGDLDAATKAYRRAVQAAPAWDLAARAMGLVLVRDKKVPQAIPYLKTYVEGRSASPDAVDYAREIERYQKTLAARLAEENRVRDRLSKDDIARGIRKSYPILEPCLKSARKARTLAVGTDTLILSWTIRQDGTTASPRLEGPTTLLMSEPAECIERALLSWRFPRFSAGSEVTVSRVPLKVRGSSAAPAASASAPAASESAAAPADEPLFSVCERDADEIQEYLRSRYGRVQACILAERRRAPKVAFPDSLPITLVVDASGPVRGIGINHRFYREGLLAQCVGEALAGDLPPAKGADCPAEFSIDLRALVPPHR